jgi:3-phytase/alkaline phosphatase D
VAADGAGERGAPYVVAHVILPTGTRAFGQEIGGLSGLAYDAGADLFYAVLDDPRKSPPPRLFLFRWHPPEAPAPVGWLALTVDGAPLPAEGADLEGVALHPGGGVLVSSEGDVDDGVAPWVGHFDAGGDLLARLPVPPHFNPGTGSGPPVNAGFEALTVDLARGTILAGTEGELLQDEAARAERSPRLSRLLRWDLAGPAAPREWLYPLDEPHARSLLPDGLRISGLVELAPEAGGGMLALERSFVTGAGFAIRLYRLDPAAAREVTGEAPPPAGARPVRKRLLADLGRLGVPLDNYEGMAWGPAGPDRRRLLVLVSDNNFRAQQQTHLVAISWRAPG